MTKWGSKIEIERRKRIELCVFAYAYEIENDPIITDSLFDKKCLEIDESISTKNVQLDLFFKNKFDPFTSIWIYEHPDLNGIKRIYNEYYKL